MYGRRMQVLHEFYKWAYGGGSISEEKWWDYEWRASAVLNRYKRIYTVNVPEQNDPDAPDPEHMAICAIADALAYFDAALNGTGGPVSSASIGSVSTSYAGAYDGLDLSPKGQEKELYRCACLYLDIYRGVG